MLYNQAETHWIPTEKIILSQNWVNKNKVETLRDCPEVREVSAIAVHIDDYVFVMDGHHRAYAAYLRGDKEFKVKLVDLNKLFTERVERHKGKEKIDLYDITAADIQEIGLLD